jgi:hypothetical protein
MANEYLKRTPTSTGNRKVWTLSCWAKISGVTGADLAFFGAYRTGTSQGDDIFFRTGTGGAVRFTTYNGTSYEADILDNAYKRDNASWMHVIAVANTTAGTTIDRWHLYVNGVRITDTSNNTYPSANLETNINNLVQHYIGAPTGGDLGQVFDIFFVDGQALTPEVFGFYKDGNGYISAGSTQATDFRPGQWVPKAPRVIKTEINRRGGFGVNGYYLPMNDSSNFGADFHTTPNSIITLKGEDLPQPRNGAPTTTDAYVSQLRTDPYAANLVLAVPGISTYRGPELVSEETFNTGSTGSWTISRSATLTVVDNKLRVTNTTLSTSGAHLPITCEVGKVYNFSFEIGPVGANDGYVGISDSDTYAGGSFAYGYQQLVNGFYSVTFKANATTQYIHLHVYGGSTGNFKDFDNISVREVNEPTDYSANIKGSGSNKTLTVNGGAGIADIPSYYGSAMSFDGSNDYFDVASSSDYNLGTSDYTIECWVNPTTITTTGYYKRIWDLGTGLYNSLSMTMQSTDNSFKFRYNDGILLTSASNSVNTSQWSHICLERYGSQLSLYLNGTTVGIVTNHTASYDYSSNTFRIGQTHESGSNGEASSVNGYIQDLRVYKGVAKYKGGFDVPKPYTPVGIATWRAVPDCTANNFATLNPLRFLTSNSLSDGNLQVTSSTTAHRAHTGTIGFGTTGKYYAECRVTSDCAGLTVAAGFGFADNQTINYATGSGNYVIYSNNNSGRIVANSSTLAVGVAAMVAGAGDIYQLAYDAGTGKAWVGKDDTWFDSSGGGTGDPAAGSNQTFTLTGDVYPYAGAYNNTVDINFGQNPTFSGQTTAGTFTDSNGKGLFKYEPPSGFLALCEDNLPTPAIKNPGEHFKTVLWTGDGNVSREITGVGFAPDLVWLKSRTSTNNHQLLDSVRGWTNLSSNNTNTEGTTPAIYGSSDGFSHLNGGSNNFNGSGNTYVAWCWRAGAGTTSTNTDGSINSVVSVNQDAGFSIVSYTISGTSAYTTGHGLNQAPEFIIWKSRNRDAGWSIYHKDIGNANVLRFTTAGASATGSWNSTTPTSSIVSHGGYYDGDKIIYYAWHSVEGFSKFGIYSTNSSTDGPFVYLGFKPAFLLVKPTYTSNWIIMDSSRGPTNPDLGWLYPDLNAIEETGSSRYCDFLSNGFKVRSGGTGMNNGGSVIFAAFAESPFTTANAK